MRIGRVAAHNKDAVCVLHIVVAGRRRVGAQRELVASHGAAHAQARIGVNVVGANQAFGELVKGVIVFSQQLARHIKAHGIWPVLLNDAGKVLAGQAQC